MVASNPFGVPQHELVQRLVDQLSAARGAEDWDRYWSLRGAAKLVLGYTDRHVRRLEANGGPLSGERSRWEPDETVVEALARHVVKGKVNRAAAYDYLVRTGNPPAISKSQFRRRYYDIPRERRGFIEGGPRGRQNEEPRIRQFYDEPFQSLHFDGWVVKLWCRPPVWYVPPDGAPVIQATALNVLDHHTRVVPGMPEVVPGALNHTNVQAALSRAVLRTPEWGPYHGVPGEIHWDNATAHLANALTALLLAIDFSVVATDPYQPQQNGAVENLHNYLVKRFLPSMPFYTGGRQREDGVVYQPRLEDCPPFEWVRDEYIRHLREYNEVWEIEDREDKTPLQLWHEAAERGWSPEPPAEDVTRLLTHREERADVVRGAITIKNVTYIHGALGADDVNGRPVRLWNRTVETVDVYDLNGRHICRAENERFASDDTLDDVRSGRSTRRRGDGALQKRITEAQQEELEAINSAYGASLDPGFERAVDELRDVAAHAGLNTPVDDDDPALGDGVQP
jgi:transposase InsO family protein